MKNSGEFKIILGSTLFSLIPVCVLYGNELSIQGLLFGRLFIACLILYLADRNRSKLLKISLKTFLKLTCWSLLMLGAMVFYFLAIEFSNMSISSTLLGTQPLIIILLAALMLKEKISKQTILAGVITLVGVMLVTGISDLFSYRYFLGEMFAIISAILLSLNFVIQKKYFNQFNGHELVFYQCLFQLPFLLPFLFFSPGKFGISSFASILILGVVCTVFSYTLIYNGIKKVSAQKIGVLQSVEYVIPILIGFLFYNEKQNLFGFVGMLLIIGACIMVGFQKNATIHSDI